jgi:hypothetical protein
MTVPASNSIALRPPRAAALAMIIGATLLASACSRAVAVGTTPAATYAVSVTNAAGADLAVSYDDGSGPRALGLVPAGRTERFVIASPRRTTVTIAGSTPDGSRTATPVEAQLQIGSTVSITLR